MAPIGDWRSKVQNRVRTSTLLSVAHKRYLYRATDIYITNTLSQRLPRQVHPPSPLSVAADELSAIGMVGTILLNALSINFRLSPSVLW
jgi:hypothetical protein